MAMGAFIAGLLIADSPYRHEVLAEIEPFRGLLLGLFFMSMGMSLEVSAFLEQPAMILGMLVSLIGIKFIVLWPLAQSFGLRVGSGAAVALLLAQSGEFALVIFGYAFQAELLDASLFQQLLAVVVLSMLATPLLAYLGQRLASLSTPESAEQVEEPPMAPVVLAGFGRVGRRIGKILASADLPYVAIDYDSSVVKRERANGHHVYFGDGRRPDVLRSIGAGDADLAIVTVDDLQATEAIVASLRAAYPHITILARGHDAKQCRTLRDLGASLAVSENLETSLELAREVLIDRLNNPDQVETSLRRFREDYYASVDNEIAIAPADDQNR